MIPDEELKKLCEQATAGPWSFSNGRLLRVTNTSPGPVVVCGVHKLGRLGGVVVGDYIANAKFIAASRLWIPAALERLAAKDLEIARLKMELGKS